MAKKKGYQYRKAKSVPAKADEKKQKHFLNCVLADLLKDAEKGLKKVYFADGVHLIYGYEKGYCWSKETVWIPSGYGRKRVNVLGFLDSVTHQVLKVMDRDEKYLNAESVCRGLKRIREQNPSQQQIYIILDNVPYQHCKKVQETAAQYKIQLIFLPPYSPNLNLIERFWKFLRKNLLSVRYYSSFDEFYDAVYEFVDNAHLRFKERLNSLLSSNFQILDISFCSNRG